jgi:predicted CoA-binding protein
MSAAQIETSAPPRTTREQIVQFLAQKRFAAVGVSRKPQDFSRMLVMEFQRRGYEVIPVNPGVAELEGKKCYPTVQAVDPPVSAALLLTSPEITERVVEDCVAAGVTQLWMHRASGRGAVSISAVETCRRHGISVIAGECPFMFFPQTGFPHRIHGLIRKIFGTFPG